MDHGRDRRGDPEVWHHEASVDAALAEAERQANKAIADAAK